MFGMTMRINHGVPVTLRAMCRDDVPVLTAHFSSMKVHMCTMGIFGQPLESELEWFDKNRQDPDSVGWVIVPPGQETPIGITSLNKINSRENACSSGIIIWDQSWWGKGIASAAHLGRTLFAADYLNRFIIRSSVRTVNPGSFRALLRVGYTIWGTEPRCVMRAGKWLDTYHLAWLHPDRIGILYPEGLPEMYAEGVERAKIALDTARREVEFP